ncbi:hypothetical protein BU16DRAFT_260298 [Lophium mytilinum]|uniref:F-box domain-containing protein n=1 Tax=Lophium mytilinum TaxID=390894 RepID=A0A6A6R8V5_9PEZI|nr:hypothetical protein BU16DRAFT_260298 [Lophium mytilinum]
MSFTFSTMANTRNEQTSLKRVNIEAEIEQPSPKRCKLELSSASPSSSKINTETSLLLALPTELRLIIYKHVLDSDPPRQLSVWPTKPFLRFSKTDMPTLFHPSDIALPAVCRHIRAECAEMIYRHHINISVHTHICLRKLTRQLGEFGLANLTHLQISWADRADTESALRRRKLTVRALLAQYVRLEKITIALPPRGGAPTTMKPEDFVLLHGLSDLAKKGVKVEIYQHGASWDSLLYGVEWTQEENTWVDAVGAILEVVKGKKGQREKTSFVV